MSRLAVIPWLFCLAGLPAAEAPDLLRFTNGDQLHGTLLGIRDGPQAVWQRDDLAAPVGFKSTLIRQVVLHGGRPVKPLASLSHLGLVNGDRLPGTITGLDGTAITLDTGYAGVLRIPRGQVALAAPNPLGGRVYYHGPFVESEWKMVHASFPDGLPPPAPAAKVSAEPPAANELAEPPAKESAGSPGRWVFAGSAWYWKNKEAGTALIRETGMPERALLRFNLAWKNRLCMAIGFHADFARTKAREGDDNKNRKVRGFVPGEAADLPRMFGNSYVLQIYSNYLMLYRTAVSSEGKPSLEQVQLNNNNLRLMETGEARVEVRSNRLSGVIALFVNDEFVAQWNESEGGAHGGASFAGKGAGLGFVVQGEDSPLRISDITVSEWNGMPDSARSMEVDDQDVVLMANGTDRYAGRVGCLDARGDLIFEGKHGQFHFPLDEVAEIRFARDRLATAADAAGDQLLVRFSPLGAVSGRVLASDGPGLRLLSPCVGLLNLALDSAVMLDFNSTKQLIDDWNTDF